MDKKTLSTISISKSFNKKWWDSNRSSKIKGTGTGALLDAWQKATATPVEKMSAAQIKAAQDASAKLDDSLNKARKLCGKAEKDDQDGIDKMLGLLEVYSGMLIERSTVLAKRAEVLKELTNTYNEQKPVMGQIAKEMGELREELKRLEERAKEDLSEVEKNRLITDLKKVATGGDELAKRLEKSSLPPKNAQRSKEGDLKEARADKGFAAAIKQFDVALNGFDEISDQLHDEIKMLETDVTEAIKDAEGTETIDTTLKSLERYQMSLGAPTFQSWGDLVDKARVWLPKIIDAKKNPTKLSPKDWEDFVGLEKEIVGSARQASAADGQIARTIKISQKAAKRFEDDPRVTKAMQGVTHDASVLFKDRANMQKSYPVMLKQLQDLLTLQP